MAQLVLSAIGATIGARIGSGAVRAVATQLGRAAGSAIGGRIDDALFGEARRAHGPRINDLYLSESSEGAGVAKIYGRARAAGQVVWAARFKETQTTQESRTGGKGGARVKTSRYQYSLSFAVALAEGPIAGLGQVWANGAVLDLSTVAYRLHTGQPDQAPDPLIEAIEGAGKTPAYRGIAYLVFEDLPLEAYGNTVPSISAEVIAPAGGPERLEQRARGVCLIPGAGEFVYATSVIRRTDGAGGFIPENAHAAAETANLSGALDQLQAELPGVTSVLLVVSWFGDDLRCGDCAIKPGVETAAKITTPRSWQVGPTARGQAVLISQHDGGPAFGGTPDDASVLEAIAALKARGLKVGLYPFILMDIPAGNAKPDPYGGAGQAAYPWRGRITASIAPGRAGTPDKTAALTAQVNAFFGAAQAAQFPVTGGAVGYSGPAEWSFRRFILHYAKLAVAAGGVDSFILGSELVGLTTLRDGAASYPAVTALRTLAQDVRAVLGPSPVLTYAADWTEYAGHRPQDGTGDVFFHLDPLWADSAISVVGVDWYPPLSDWRDGAHLDASLAAGCEDSAYLQGLIEAGEAFDWFYASPQHRAAQTRTAITDGAHGKPWVFRAKDVRSFWANAHYNRPGGVEAAQPTAWVAQSKPIWLVELGCPAIDKGANSPNLFIDDKSSESAWPLYSSGARDDLIQRRVLEAYLSHWAGDSATNPISSVDGRRMIDPSGVHLWCWDARPYPAFPAKADVWADASAWRRGHWLNGRVGAADAASVIADLCARAGLSIVAAGQAGGLVAGMALEGPTAMRDALSPLMALQGLVARVRDGVLRFERPQTPAHAIALAAYTADGAPERHRPSPDEAPGALHLRFLDPAQRYAVGEVTAIEPGAVGRSQQSLSAPFVLNREQAKAFAQHALADARAQRETVEFALAPGDLALEPGDLATFGEGVVWRVRRVLEGAARRLTVSAHVAWSGLRDGGEVAAEAVAAAATPAVLVLDAPALPGAETDTRPMAAVRTSPWIGDISLYAGDAPLSATARGTAFEPAGLGVLEWALWPGPVGRLDRGNRIRVRIPGAALASVTTRALLDGANAFAVLAPDGIWEVFQARDAVLAGPDVYELSCLLRAPTGRRPLTTPIPVGAPVVVLDDRLARITMQTHEEGAPLSLFAPPAGRAPSHPATASAAFTWTQAALSPFAPAHLRAVAQPNGDTLVSWIRCARVGGDAWGPAEPPQEPEGESYDVAILRNGVTVRTVSVGQAPFNYTSAMRAADFGTGGEAHVRVRQRGAGGRLGWPRESAL
jgi:GTA TIM-barrel-like domain/Putative phage tail protein